MLVLYDVMSEGVDRGSLIIVELLPREETVFVLINKFKDLFEQYLLLNHISERMGGCLAGWCNNFVGLVHIVFKNN